jgi:hypothetical protein
MNSHQFPLEAIADHFELGRVISHTVAHGGVMNHNAILTTSTGEYFIKHITKQFEAKIPFVYKVEHGMSAKGIPSMAMIANSRGEFQFSDESGVELLC